jgi:hypothetical protein
VSLRAILKRAGWPHNVSLSGPHPAGPVHCARRSRRDPTHPPRRREPPQLAAGPAVGAMRLAVRGWLGCAPGSAACAARLRVRGRLSARCCCPSVVARLPAWFGCPRDTTAVRPGFPCDAADRCPRPDRLTVRAARMFARHGPLARVTGRRRVTGRCAPRAAPASPQCQRSTPARRQTGSPSQGAERVRAPRMRWDGHRPTALAPLRRQRDFRPPSVHLCDELGVSPWGRVKRPSCIPEEGRVTSCEPAERHAGEMRAG